MASPIVTEPRKLRVGLLSLGCPKTLVDSELILGKLDSEKYSLTESVNDCDVAMVNTCAFIHSAQEESVDHILRLIELKKEGGIKKLIVMGCLYQRFPRELEKELKEVDAFVGSGEYDKIAEVVDRVVGGESLAKVGLPGYLYTSGEARVSLTPTYSRYVKISEGCDHTCSFCVIPSFRGRHRSRRMEDVIEEAEKLVAEGARELILTGQDTTFYGYDLEGKLLLPSLLQRLNEISGLRWIRLLYAYPSLVTDPLIDAIATLEKVCHYLDMPLQHVSDRVLRSMKRGTNRRSTRRLVTKLRKKIPDLAIRTTFIVGYPEETEKEFRELLDFMEEARFDRLGIFVYSPEKGSAAAHLPNQVPHKIKVERFEKGMSLQQKISEENNRRMLGSTYEVLVEDYLPEEGVWLGRTYMDAPEVDGTVVLSNSSTGREEEDCWLRPGGFTRAQIIETRQYDLVGIPLGPCHA